MTVHAESFQNQRLYCQRGEMENRIKECQLDPFTDRMSNLYPVRNRLRLWFASMTYVLLCPIRRIGLARTRLAAATCGAIRRVRMVRLHVWSARILVCARGSQRERRGRFS